MHNESPAGPAVRGSANNAVGHGGSAVDVGDFDTALTVNDAVASYPETMAVFNRYGIDTCCGGGVSIAEAAQRDEIDMDELVDALRQAVAGA